MCTFTEEYLTDLDNDDDVHDEDADARDNLGQDALEDHHNHPHWVVIDAALLCIAPAVLISQLIMALTWLDFLFFIRDNKNDYYFQ